MGLSDEERREKVKRKFTYEDQVLSDYLEIKADPIESYKDGFFDWGPTQRRLDAYLAQVSEANREYVLRNQNRWINTLGVLGAMVEREREADMQFIAETGYWDLDSEGRLALRDARPELDAILNFWDFAGVVRSQKAFDLLRAKADKMGRPYGAIPALSE
jgi:hypothetical protein